MAIEPQSAVAPQSEPRLAALLDSLPTRCGVYRFIDESGTLLYVGKARNLKSRVSSYFKPTGLTNRIMSLVARISDIQFTVLTSETEALLLEQSFIKSERPQYNVLLRDDKSYPYIEITNHAFPQIRLHRGSIKGQGTFFGPYPSTSAVRNSISILQKVFHLRPCKDSFFSNRSRACLQYQIKRCSGPCVDLIDAKSYDDDLELAKLFLEGKSQTLLDDLKARMQTAAQTLAFERAAQLRDQIQSLRQVQEEQYIYRSSGSVDAFAIVTQDEHVCIQGMFIREGRLLGHRNWFLTNELGHTEYAMLGAFLSQYYFGGIEREVPHTVLPMIEFEDQEILAHALSERAGRRIEVTTQVRSARAKWQEMVQDNAQLALASYIQARTREVDRMNELTRVLDLPEVPRRVECFDISHAHGEGTVASCVVFDRNGPLKSQYRRFKIRNVEASDDYGALAQAVERRFTRLIEEDSTLPDILIIDGGRGQINKVQQSLAMLLDAHVVLLGISKDEQRRSGRETIWRYGQGIVELASTSGAFLLLQQIRDEAHRFAVTGHRAVRKRNRAKSELDSVEGIGPQRKRNLITHFGSVAAVRLASVDELAKVPGINQKLANQIYNLYHAN